LPRWSTALERSPKPRKRSPSRAPNVMPVWVAAAGAVAVSERTPSASGAIVMVIGPTGFVVASSAL
jgi:hypothetical protein